MTNTTKRRASTLGGYICKSKLCDSVSLFSCKQYSDYFLFDSENVDPVGQVKDCAVERSITYSNLRLKLW